MAIIGGSEQIRTLGPDADLVNRGPAGVQSRYSSATVSDIVETVQNSTDEYEVIITRLWSQGNDLSSATEIKNTSNRSLTWSKSSEGFYQGVFDGAIGSAPNFSKVFTFASQVNRHQTDLPMITQAGYWYQQAKITARTFRLTDTTTQAGTSVLEPENLGTGGQGYMLVEVRIYP